jgi:hypothetical protein
MVTIPDGRETPITRPLTEEKELWLDLPSNCLPRPHQQKTLSAVEEGGKVLGKMYQ